MDFKLNWFKELLLEKYRVKYDYVKSVVSNVLYQHIIKFVLCIDFVDSITVVEEVVEISCFCLRASSARQLSYPTSFVSRTYRLDLADNCSKEIRKTITVELHKISSKQSKKKMFFIKQQKMDYILLFIIIQIKRQLKM